MMGMRRRRRSVEGRVARVRLLLWGFQLKGTNDTRTLWRPVAGKMARAAVTIGMGTEKITRPSSMVAMKAKICTLVGIATASEAAEKKPSEMLGRPVAYM